MPRYSTYGKLDDKVMEDGDRGFLGFNNRLRPDQLKPGTLADSQNGRMGTNGEWQVRKGIDLVLAPIATSGALTIPCFIRDSTINSASINLNTPSSGNIQINFASAHGFTVGATGDIELTNLTGIAPAVVDGPVPITVVDADSVKITNQTYTAAPSGTVVLGVLTIDDDAINGVQGSCAFSDPNKDDSQSIILATNTKAIAYNLNTEKAVDLTYPASATVGNNVDMIQAFNKVFIFRDGATALENELKISTISTASVVGSSNVCTINTSTDHNLSTGDSVTIANLGFSTTDPNGSGKTITKTSDTAFTYSLTASGDETYTVTSDPTVSTEFTLVASGEYTQPLSIFTSVKDFAIINLVGGLHTSQSLNVGDVLTLTDDGPTASCGLTEPSEFIINKTFSSSAAVTVNAVAISGTTLTVGTDGAHGLSLNQPISFTNLQSDVNGNQIVSKVNSTSEFEVEVASTFSVTDTAGNVTPAAGVSFVIEANDITSAKTQAQVRASDPVFIQSVSVGLGFTHMPAPPFATYHQRRLVMPFNYTVNDAANSFTANGTSDQVIASDILDSDTYDQIYANFRFNAGTADFINGLHSFSDDTLIVFNRNSIHLIQNSTVLNQATSKLLTDEIGCLARKSIQQIGNQILFLSDNGVYGIGFIEGYQLRGIQVPLSESIQATVDRINKEHRSKALSVYFDNKYYLAVPLDNSSSNNAIIVYNFLNQQWESVDTVSVSNYSIDNMFIAGTGDNIGVYTTNVLGGINKLEARVDNIDQVITVVGGATQQPQIQGSASTRQFTFNTLDRKKWRSFDMHVESSSQSQSDFDISAELENLDRTVPVGTLSGFNGTTLDPGSDVSIRGRLGNPRAYGLQLTINNTVGRPILRAIKVDGIESFRSVDKAE
tara:strand:+ start:317 stop:2989 length:2673 start_codon:yes stop_codon:yes gene_type:complete